MSFKHWILLGSLSIFLAACNNDSTSTEVSAPKGDAKAQQKLEQSSENKEPVKAKLIISDDQPALKEKNNLDLLNQAMTQHPTIEAGVVDIVPLAAAYNEGNLTVMFFLRNGKDKTITYKELEKMTLTVESALGEKIGEVPLVLKKEAVGKLKTGDVRVIRADFNPEQFTIKDYDFTKGYNAYIH
jgi:SLAP domain-containing protein